MTLSEKLADAETAYHNLVTGKSARVIVDQNGERVEYTQANSSRLASYIEDLKRQLGQADSGSPMRVWL